MKHDAALRKYGLTEHADIKQQLWHVMVAMLHTRGESNFCVLSVC